MHRRLLGGLAVCAMALVAFLATALAGGRGETVYARRPRVAVRSSQDPFESEVVVYARYGEKIEVLERTGRWLRVRYRDKEGFVHAANVSEKKPKDLDERAAVRLGAGDVSGGAASMPFGQVARTYGKNHPKANMNAVETIEKVVERKGWAKSLDAFQRAGRLGDYAQGGAR